MYTTSDLAKVELAILKLQAGERVAQVAYGDHVVRYSEVQLTELLSLRSRMQVALQQNRKRQIVFATTNGIDK